MIRGVALALIMSSFPSPELPEEQPDVSVRCRCPRHQPSVIPADQRRLETIARRNIRPTARLRFEANVLLSDDLHDFFPLPGCGCESLPGCVTLMTRRQAILPVLSEDLRGTLPWDNSRRSWMNSGLSRNSPTMSPDIICIRASSSFTSGRWVSSSMACQISCHTVSARVWGFCLRRNRRYCRETCTRPSAPVVVQRTTKSMWPMRTLVHLMARKPECRPAGPVPR